MVSPIYIGPWNGHWFFVASKFHTAFLWISFWYHECLPVTIVLLKKKEFPVWLWKCKALPQYVEISEIRTGLSSLLMLLLLLVLFVLVHKARKSKNVPSPITFLHVFMCVASTKKKQSVSFANRHSQGLCIHRMYRPSNYRMFFLVGGLEHELYDFGNVIIPTDFHSIIFQRGRAQNHQPIF